MNWILERLYDDIIRPIEFLPLFSIVYGMWIGGDKPSRLILRSVVFILLALLVFFECKNSDVGLSLIMTSVGGFALSLWYWLRTKKHPELPKLIEEARTKHLKKPSKQ